jgi:hypothetical protein
MEAAPYFTEQLADTSSAAGTVRDADAAATVTGPDRTFDARLPCAADEGPAQGCDGREVTVRTPDPLLPGRGAPHVVVPSKGARRFGDEMALVGAREALDS